MRLCKRDRAALILLMAGVIALAVDRLLLPPPAAAEGARGADSDSSVAAPAPPGREALPPLPAATSEAPPLGTVPDVFDLARLPVPGTAAPAPPGSRPEETTVEAFVRRHTLQATIFGPNPVALVGQRTLHIGDVLDGFVLESISDREAAFLSENGRAVLRVAARAKRP